MLNTLPNLIEQVLTEATSPLEQRLELRRLRVAYERRHAPKATAGPAAGARIAHGSIVPSGWPARSR